MVTQGGDRRVSPEAERLIGGGTVVSGDPHPGGRLPWIRAMAHEAAAAGREVADLVQEERAARRAAYQAGLVRDRSGEAAPPMMPWTRTETCTVPGQLSNMVSELGSRSCTGREAHGGHRG